MCTGVTFVTLFALCASIALVAFFTLVTFLTLRTLFAGVTFVTLCTIFDNGGGAVGEGNGVALSGVGYVYDGEVVGKGIEESLLSINLRLHLILLLFEFLLSIFEVVDFVPKVCCIELRTADHHCRQCACKKK